MEMRSSVLIVIAVLLISPVLAQDLNLDNRTFHKKNSINVELGGYAFLGSLNYERVILNNRKYKTTGQLGFGYLGFPIVLHQLISFNKHHVELGFGVVLPSPLVEDQYYPFLTGRIGYRFQKPSGNFIFRAGIMPVILGPDKGGEADMFLWAWPGLSFGWTF
ncbi:MAG: hypothetical protein IT213_09155 [Cytophagales bacterium]|jgi:hypothetical protein|nr:hypothetical protein [Cytophagales bacterium]